MKRRLILLPFLVLLLGADNNPVIVRDIDSSFGDTFDMGAIYINDADTTVNIDIASAATNFILSSTDADGTLAFISAGTLGALTDHGVLLGRADDDHTQYLLHTEADTEAELETLLTDVTDVYTNNDVVLAADGGTGQSSYAVGDLLFASGATALSKLADVATGNAVISGGVGVAPSWGKIALATHVSGTLPEANGGTGDTDLDDIVGTSNQITVTAGANTIIAGDATLSLPQDIHTDATPTFDQLTLDGAHGQLTVGASGQSGKINFIRGSGGTFANFGFDAAGVNTPFHLKYSAGAGEVRINAVASNSKITFYQNNLEKMRVETDGNIEIKSGSDLVLEGGDLTVQSTGEINGSPRNHQLSYGGFAWPGPAALNNSAQGLGTGNAHPNSSPAITSQGIPCIRAGSFTGISANFLVTSANASSVLVIRVYKNTTLIFTHTLPTPSSAAAFTSTPQTQARGTDAFAAGDVLSAYIVETNSQAVSVDDVFCTLEIYYD